MSVGVSRTEVQPLSGFAQDQVVVMRGRFHAVVRAGCSGGVDSGSDIGGVIPDLARADQLNAAGEVVDQFVLVTARLVVGWAARRRRRWSVLQLVDVAGRTIGSAAAGGAAEVCAAKPHPTIVTAAATTASPGVMAMVLHVRNAPRTLIVFSIDVDAAASSEHSRTP
jgi:hypothetical protein